MTTRILYFLLGAAFSALVCYKYFSSIIHSQTSALNSTANNALFHYKLMHTDDASQLIFQNVKTIQSLNKIPDELIKTEVSRLLLASTILLNGMTVQDIDLQNDVLVTAAYYYAKLDKRATEQEKMTRLKSICEVNLATTDCTEAFLMKLMETVK